MTDPYLIRNMSLADLKVAVDWAAAEGWNPGLQDVESFFAADPQGFLIGELDGEPIASISCVRYGEDFGFIGLYIVKPTCRGKGYGLRIWQAAMNQLDGRCIGLDGVLAQQHNYQRSGFMLSGRNVRYQGVSQTGRVGLDSSVIALNAVPFAQLAAYDRHTFSQERSNFLHHWITALDHVALGYQVDGNLVGYGVIRPCQIGYKIGPLFAHDNDVAQALFSSLLSHIEPGQPVFLDVPESNASAAELAVTHGMTIVFETARMYRGDLPFVPMPQIYGITSFELG